MSTSAAVQQILQQIDALPVAEQQQLQAELTAKLQQTGKPQSSAKPPRDRRVDPIPLPNQQASADWINQHDREYQGYWIALDEDRLIAHGPSHAEVRAAANASGAYLSLVTFIECYDAPPFAGSDLTIVRSDREPNACQT